MKTETTTDLILRQTTEGAWRPLIKRIDVATGDEKTVMAGPLCDSPTGAYKSIIQALQRTAKQPGGGATSEAEDDQGEP